MAARETEEVRIANAIKALDAGDYDTITEAAQVFKVSYQKLQARRLGRPASSSQGGHNKLLLEA
jgi:hypothetical protein